MAKPSERWIGTKNGSEKFLEWVKGSQYRNHATFDEFEQLDIAKKIAAIDDKVSRDLLLKLLGTASHLQRMCVEQKKEMETVHKVLLEIEKEMTADATTESKGNE